MIKLPIECKMKLIGSEALLQEDFWFLTFVIDKEK